MGRSSELLESFGTRPKSGEAFSLYAGMIHSRHRVRQKLTDGFLSAPVFNPRAMFVSPFDYPPLRSWIITSRDCAVRGKKNPATSLWPVTGFRFPIAVTGASVLTSALRPAAQAPLIADWNLLFGFVSCLTPSRAEHDEPIFLSMQKSTLFCHYFQISFICPPRAPTPFARLSNFQTFSFFFQPPLGRT